MAATMTRKTIKLKAETCMAAVTNPGYTKLFPAGTEASYYIETRGSGKVGVVELIEKGVPYRAERPLAVCSCGHDAPKPAPVPVAVATPRTLTNDRNGQTVTTTLSNAELAAAFAELVGSDDRNWLWYWMAKTINDARPTHQGGSNVTSALDFLADSFVVAVGYGLLSPMIRVHYKDQRFKFYLSARGTICLKSGGLAMQTVCSCGQCKGDVACEGKQIPTQAPVGEEEYVGCLLRGQFLPARVDQPNNVVTRRLTATETEFLAKLGADPVAFLAQCSKDMCRCCYCYAALEDARSKEKGYGKRCSERWGLAWGNTKSGESTPSFAKVYGQTAHEIITTIRTNPQDETAWLVFGDWLEENGLRRPGKINPKSRFPRLD